MAKIATEFDLFIYPTAAVLVSCGVGRNTNIITLGAVAKICWEPPLAGVSIRPSRYSHGLIRTSGEFVINMPTVEQAKWTDYCGRVSGRDHDKWTACGFHRAPALAVRVPVIAECPMNVECRVREILSLGSHDFFVGEVVAIQVEEKVLDNQNRLIFQGVKPFAFVDWQYREVGERLGDFGFSEGDSGKA
jgi:flavin reductase (DIM6/NTAB) family NADH-FMN oxidoreductase RutF